MLALSYLSESADPREMRRFPWTQVTIWPSRKLGLVTYILWSFFAGKYEFVSLFLKLPTVHTAAIFCGRRILNTEVQPAENGMMVIWVFAFLFVLSGSSWFRNLKATELACQGSLACLSVNDALLGYCDEIYTIFSLYLWVLSWNWCIRPRPTL